jgi:hypothetical protein
MIVALENERLRELLLAHGIDPNSGDVKGSGSSQKKLVPDRIVIPEGDGRYPSETGLKIENASGKMNALSVSYGSLNGIDINAIVSGGVDKILRVYDLEGNPRGQYEFPAPILAIDTFESLVSCSFMDGGHALVTSSLTFNNLTRSIWLSLIRLSKLSKHTKHIQNMLSRLVLVVMVNIYLLVLMINPLDYFA